MRERPYSPIEIMDLFDEARERNRHGGGVMAIEASLLGMLGGFLWAIFFFCIAFLFT